MKNNKGNKPTRLNHLRFILIFLSLMFSFHLMAANKHQIPVVNSDFWSSPSNDHSLNELLLFMVDHPLTTDDSMMSETLCQTELPAIENQIKKYNYIFQLHHIAMQCHLLDEDEEAADQHQAAILQIAQLTMQDSNGKEVESPIRTTDLYSAYQLMRLSGFEVEDGILTPQKDSILLKLLVKSDDLFLEERFLDITSFLKGYHSSGSDNKAWKNILSQTLSDKLLGQNEIIDLAYDGLPEAILSLADLMLHKTEKLLGLYTESVALLESMAQQGHLIAQYAYALRIFNESSTENFPLALQYLDNAVQARFFPAFVLSIVIREKGINPETDKDTIDTLLELASTKSKVPGELAYEIFRIFSSDNTPWTDKDLGFKYFEKAIAANNPSALILQGKIDGDYSQLEVNPHYQLAEKYASKHTHYQNLGLVYLLGVNTKQNTAKAIKLFTQSVDSGSTTSSLVLGMIYIDDDNGSKDLDKSFHWFTEAAKHKSASAYHNLAIIHLYGQGRDIDLEKAFDYFAKATDKEHEESYIYLAKMYHEGLHVEKDVIKAKHYYLMSNSNQKNVFASLNLKLLNQPNYIAATDDEHFEKQLMENVDSEEPLALFQNAFLQINNSYVYAPKSAMKLLKQSADLGFAPAYTLLATIDRIKGKSAKKVYKTYLKGYELGDVEAGYRVSKYLRSKNDPTWFEHLNKAFMKNHPDAILDMAALYLEGTKVEKNKDKAIELYTMALDMGEVGVARTLVNLYLDSDDLVNDADKAIDVLESLIDSRDYVTPIRNIAEIYGNKNYHDYNPEKSMTWFLKAAEREDEMSNTMLGYKYFFGIDVEQDFNLALFFYSNAIGNFSHEARFWLGLMNERGLGVEKSPELALYNYKLAGVIDNVKASLNNRILITCQSDANKKEKKEAFKKLQNLAEKSETSEFNLAWFYEKGICTKVNHKKSKKHYAAAAKRGSYQALYYLYLNNLDSDPTLAESYLKQSKEIASKLKHPDVITTLIDIPFIKNQLYIATD